MTPIIYRTKLWTAVGILTGTILLSACENTVLGCQSDCPVENTQSQNIVDTAAEAGNFTRFLAAWESSSLSMLLADDTQEFTVFAPTDEAFGTMNDAAFTALLANSDMLNDVLLYHVTAGRMDAQTANGMLDTPIAMANNKAALLTRDGDDLKINTATIVTRDMMASNGVIHAIDGILSPPAQTIPVNLVETAANAGNLNTLVLALEQSGFDQTFADESQDFTLFAPTDAAFDALGTDAVTDLLADSAALNSTLLYHVAPTSTTASAIESIADGTLTMEDGSKATITSDGSTLSINGATIITTDIIATNGVIHIIDAVLTPPGLNTTVKTVNLTSTLAKETQYSSLFAALKNTGLDAVLADTTKTFTVFAPNNAAFAAADADIQAALTTDPDILRSVLLGHVLPDLVVNAKSAEALAGSSITMANATIRQINSNAALQIDNATIVDADIEASNGIIHGIDTVLLGL